METRTMHLTEDELALLAIVSAAHDGGRSVDHPHIRRCALCREKLGFYVAFYANLAVELSKKETGARSYHEAPGAAVNVVRFSPWESEHPTARTEPVDSELILAAKTMTDRTDRYRTVATFSSSNPPAILRVLEDRKEQVYRVFVLSQEPTIRDRVNIVIADEVGNAVTARTDPHGVALLTVPENFDWTHSHIAVVSPASDGSPSPTL
ncbi:MAG TPA: hypothetical protein VMG09_00815 [Bacteroidota bacterium]|nr:hypothetical protein [Bacteroidota bacterium]